MVARQNSQFEDLNYLGHALLSIKLKPQTDICLTNQPISNEVLKDAITFCKTAQFWSGYVRVMQKCTVDIRWEELDQILKLGNVKILSDLEMMKTKDDCINILDHCNAMWSSNRPNEGNLEINIIAGNQLV